LNLHSYECKNFKKWLTILDSYSNFLLDLRFYSKYGDNLEIKKRNIIVIDDESDIRKLFKKILSSSNYTVKTYPSCEDLLSKIYYSPPDLIILDLVLPWESGEDFVKRLKAINRFSSIPVIAISGKRKTGNDLNELKQIGVNRFFQKPVNTKELCSSVISFLNNVT